MGQSFTCTWDPDHNSMIEQVLQKVCERHQIEKEKTIGCISSEKAYGAIFRFLEPTVWTNHYITKFVQDLQTESGFPILCQ